MGWIENDGRKMSLHLKTGGTIAICKSSLFSELHKAVLSFGQSPSLCAWPAASARKVGFSGPQPLSPVPALLTHLDVFPCLNCLGMKTNSQGRGSRLCLFLLFQVHCPICMVVRQLYQQCHQTCQHPPAAPSSVQLCLLFFLWL